MAPPLYKINTLLIHKERENSIENKIRMIKDEKLSNYQKRIIVLNELKTTKYFIEGNNKNKNENIFLFNDSFSQNFNNNKSFSYEYDIDSTCDNSKSFGFSQYTEYILPENQEKTLNSLRSKFCIKNKLYDITLNPNLYFPQKYKIDKSHYVFAYENEITSYGFTQSGFLTKENIKLNTILMNIEDSKYYYKLGLYFCDKKVLIKIGNEIYKKRCIPNEFMCEKCMKINKKHYNIKNKYLININGRVAKINKGSFHCFGLFLLGNQIEQCISKFSCKACSILNLYSKYYLKKEYS